MFLFNEFGRVKPTTDVVKKRTDSYDAKQQNKWGKKKSWIETGCPESRGVLRYARQMLNNMWNGDILLFICVLSSSWKKIFSTPLVVKCSWDFGSPKKLNSSQQIDGVKKDAPISFRHGSNKHPFLSFLGEEGGSVVFFYFAQTIASHFVIPEGPKYFFSPQSVGHFGEYKCFPFPNQET